MKKETNHNLLIVGSTLGTYGGMEAYMIGLADAASHWPEFNVKLCFKLVKGHSQNDNLTKAAEGACREVYFVESNSNQLRKLIGWSTVIHAQNAPPDVVFLGRMLGKKILLTVHNWRRPVNNLHTFLWRISVRLAHRRWFNSQFVWNTWEPGKKSSKSDSLLTLSKFPIGTCAPENRKGFLFIGRWIDNKGIEEILKAYAVSKFDPAKWPLTILGDGPLKPVILKLAADLNLEDIEMPGFVDEASRDNYLSTSKWLLAPAKTKEDLGLTPIEARSVGVPSIVSRDGGLPEAGGQAALIVIPGDVADLARCMQIAVNMGEEEYVQRGRLAKDSLTLLLKSADYYRQAYLN